MQEQTITASPSMLSLQRLPLFSYIWIHNVLFQANLESPIIFDRSLPRSPRSSATSVESALDLSPLQQELNLVGTKSRPVGLKHFALFPSTMAGRPQSLVIITSPSCQRDLCLGNSPLRSDPRSLIQATRRTRKDPGSSMSSRGLKVHFPDS